MTNIMFSKGRTLLSLSQVVPNLSGALLASSRCQLHGEPDYPLLPPRDDLKRMLPPGVSKDVCWQSMRRTEYKCRSDPEFNVHAFVDARKNCLPGPCPPDMITMDLTHYKPSDMGKRSYPRTWYECVVKQRKRKAHCIHKPPNRPRRKRKARTDGFCAKKECVLGAQDLELTKPCKLMKPSTCPRFKMPNCCVDVRDPPKCIRTVKAGLCRRRKTKYPSFSECRHDPIPDARPIECTCLNRPAICDMWRFYRRKNR